MQNFPRSYYNASETQFYYLQSRYYDPEVSRFINADSYASTGQGFLGFNMFAYCNNSPINFTDFSGNNPARYYMYTTPEQYAEFLASEAAADSIHKDSASASVQTGRVHDNSFIGIFKAPTKYEHYNRNQYNNVTFPQVFDPEFYKLWDDSVPADCHQLTAPNKDNVKYVSPDGRIEVIIYDINNNLVTDSRDIGTYNYCPSGVSLFGHFVKDVWPWVKYGNSPDDTTEWWERLFKFLGVS